MGRIVWNTRKGNIINSTIKSLSKRVMQVKHLYSGTEGNTIEGEGGMRVVLGIECTIQFMVDLCNMQLQFHIYVHM